MSVYIGSILPVILAPDQLDLPVLFGELVNLVFQITAFVQATGEAYKREVSLETG